MNQAGDGLPQDLTTSAAQSDPDVTRLFERVYNELKTIAHRVRGAQDGDTLRTTALVHEAYLKLASSGSLEVKSREHFFAIAARAMRQILVDAARRQLAQKRGSGVQLVSLDESLRAEPVRPAQLVALDEALTRLEATDPRLALVVEQRVFAGLTVEETATMLGVSRPTIDRDWRAARAWLAVELQEHAS
jgi:RNA polymerase sigma factor (TIGR02999 family)